MILWFYYLLHSSPTQRPSEHEIFFLLMHGTKIWQNSPYAQTGLNTVLIMLDAATIKVTTKPKLSQNSCKEELK